MKGSVGPTVASKLPESGSGNRKPANRLPSSVNKTPAKPGAQNMGKKA